MKSYKLKDIKNSLKKRGYDVVKESLNSIEENIMDAEDIGFEVERLHNIMMKMVEKGVQNNMSALGRLNSELKSLSSKIDRLVNAQDPEGAVDREMGRKMANQSDGLGE